MTIFANYLQEKLKLIMDIIQTRDFQSNREIKVKRCPSCSSVFITDTECESCGQQFWKSDEIFQDNVKNFFDLKDEYIDNRGPLEPIHDFFVKRSGDNVDKYLRFITSRGRNLLDYLTKWEDSRSFLIKSELKAILEEIYYFKQNKNVLKGMISSLGQTNHYEEIYLFIDSLDKIKPDHSVRVNWKRIITVISFALATLYIALACLQYYFFADTSL